jgi:hypothetical protein
MTSIPEPVAEQPAQLPDAAPPAMGPKPVG